MEDTPVFAPGEGYEPKAPKPVEPPIVTAVDVVPIAIHQTPLMSDPDDAVGARCHAPGPKIMAEGRLVELPCIRRRGHIDRGQPYHRAFQGEKPEHRVFYEWT